MQPAPPPPPLPGPLELSSESSGPSWLVGCAIGCGTILLVGLLLLAGFAYWLFTTGDQQPTLRIVQANSLGHAHVADLAEDKEFREMVELLAVEFKKTQGQSGVGFSQGGSSDRYLVPRDATFALDRNAEGQLELIHAINLKMFTRVISFYLKVVAQGEQAERPEVTEENGDQIYFGGLLGELAIGLHEGTIVLASSVDAARRGLIRLTDPTQAIVIDPPADPWDASGALTIQPQVSEWLKGIGLQEAALRGAERMDANLDIASTDQLTVELRIQYLGPTEAVAARSPLEAAVARLGTRLQEYGFALDHQVSIAGSEAIIPFKIQGFRAKIASWAQRLADLAAQR